MDGNGLSPPAEFYTFFTCIFVFERESTHVLLVAAIEDLHAFGTQTASGARSVNSGISSADDNNAAADLEVGASVVSCDEMESVDDGSMVFIDDAELVHGAETQAEEDAVIFVFDPR